MGFRSQKRRQDQEELAIELRELGDALKELREKAELSVRKLAEKLDVNSYTANFAGSFYDTNFIDQEKPTMSEIRW